MLTFLQLAADLFKKGADRVQTIAVINQKGGVGKSTTAAAIGAGLVLKGCKVLFVDLDAQGNITHTLKANSTGSGTMAILEDPESITGAIQKLPTAGITGGREVNGAAAAYSVIASSPRLAAADTLIDGVGKEYRLKEALEICNNDYDYCIIDTPPALGILTINALTAATHVLIPAQADIYSLQGIDQLKGTIATVRKYCNPDLEIIGIVLTRYNSRAIVSRELRKLISHAAAQLDTSLCNTFVRECTAVKEAQAIRETIYTYAPRSNAAADYKKLLREIIIF